MTGAASRNKGARGERDVANFLAAHGYPDARRELERRNDIGDITGGPTYFALEVKSVSQAKLAAYADQVERARLATRRRWGAVIMRRPGKPIERAYVIMPLAQWVELVDEHEAYEAEHGPAPETA